MRHALCLVCLLLLWPALAQAGNDDELLAGNQAAMMGGAVSAFVEDSSAIWYNPSGLGAITRDQVDVSGTVYTLRMYSATKLLTSTSGASDDAAVTEFVSIPTQIAFGAGLFSDRAPDVLDGSPANSKGDFYGATVGVELSSEHWLAAREATSSLIFSSVFALRYAFSQGELTRFLVDPEAPETLLTESLPGTLIAHELGLYVGSGLKF